MLYLTYCSFYSHTASLTQKWAWFERNVGVGKKFARASCVAILWPLQPYTCSYAYEQETWGHAIPPQMPEIYFLLSHLAIKPQGPGADPGYQVGGGNKLNNRARSARENFGHAHFVKTTPTLLPRTRQTARDVDGTRLFHLTNRFLAIFCVRSRFIS